VISAVVPALELSVVTFLHLSTVALMLQHC
jgi:hypothetical protein